MEHKKARYHLNPEPPPMVSIFATVGRAWVYRVLWACLGLILLGMALAILLFGTLPEPEKIPRVEFETWEVVLIFLSWFAIQSLAFVAWQLAMHEVHAWGRKPMRIIWNAGLVLLNAIVILLVVDVFGLKLTGNNWASLGFHRLSWSWVFGSVGLGVISMLLSGVVAALVMRWVDPNWVNKQNQFILPEQSTSALLEGTDRTPLSIPGALAMVLLVGLAVPIAEEILFRGILYAWMTEWLPWFLAAFASSVAFGLAHFQSGRPVVAGCIVAGFFMAVAFHYSHSLFAPIIVHAMNNTTKVALTYLLRE